MPRFSMRKWSVFLVIAAIVAVSVTAFEMYDHNQQNKEKEIRRSIFLSDMQSPKPAPDFTLADQNGKQISMSDLKGKIVILQFMDPVCTDICPIVSQESIAADKQLGDKQKQVEFIAVNVNEYHASRQDVLDFSKSHGLQKLANWHFVTGTKKELQQVWKDYGIEVIPNPDGDVSHSANMYFIDKKGEERYVGFPQNDAASINQWAKGIAYFSQKMM